MAVAETCFLEQPHNLIMAAAAAYFYCQSATATEESKV